MLRRILTMEHDRMVLDELHKHNQDTQKVVVVLSLGARGGRG